MQPYHDQEITIDSTGGGTRDADIRISTKKKELEGTKEKAEQICYTSAAALQDRRFGISRCSHTFLNCKMKCLIKVSTITNQTSAQTTGENNNY